MDAQNQPEGICYNARNQYLTKAKIRKKQKFVILAPNYIKTSVSSRFIFFCRKSWTQISIDFLENHSQYYVPKFRLDQCSLINFDILKTSSQVSNCFGVIQSVNFPMQQVCFAYMSLSIVDQRISCFLFEILGNLN